MAFPTGWTSLTLKIPQEKVTGSGNHSNFPILIKDGVIPAFVYTAAKSDGSDLRFTTDSAGTTEVPFEIVSYNQGSNLCEIWVKLPTLYYNQDTTFYLWYGNASASAYAASDTYGSQAVWSDYVAVFHLQANSNDSGAGARNGTDSNVTYEDDGLLKNSATLNGTSSVISLADNAAFDVSNLTVQMLIRPDAPTSGTQGLFSHYFESGATRYGLRFFLSGGNVYMVVHDGTSSTYAYVVGSTVLSANQKYLIHGRYDHSQIKVFLDGVQDGTINYTNNFNWTSCASPRIGVENYTGTNGQWFDGGIDEVRYRGSSIHVDWMATEQTMFNDPATFIISTVRTSVTKTLSYSVKTVTAITKSDQYTIKRPISVTKSAQYTIYRTIAAITKGLIYSIVPNNVIIKAIEYMILRSIGVTQSMTYAIILNQIVTRSMVYAILTEAAITKSLAYSLVADHAITKSMAYIIVFPGLIQKSMSYHIGIDGYIYQYTPRGNEYTDQYS